MGPKQVLALLTAVISLCMATPPPGYVKKPDNDKNPPKYEFGYDVRDGKGGRQGHLETRDGVYALGVYYVNLPDGSVQNVRYFVDDWGYHPLVSYTSSTKTGSTKTHFALGEKAVAALAKSKEANSLISGASPTVSTVLSKQVKTQTGTGTGNSENYILKVATDNVNPPPNSYVGIGSKISSSYQRISPPLEEQFPVSAVNNRDESNGNLDNRKYKEFNSPDKTSQRLSVSGFPTSSDGSDIPEETFSYGTGEEYQPIATKGTGSFSYQLTDIGGGLSPTKFSGSEAAVILPIVTESTNNESENKSGYEGDKKLKVISHVNNENSALKFGDRIPSLSAEFIQTIGNIQQDQNKIQKGGHEDIKVSSLPMPQRHSALRPIIVADIYTKDSKEITETERPIVIFPSTTPVSVHLSHSPQSSSTVLFSGSGSTKSGPIVTSKHEAINVHPSTTNILSIPQAVTLVYSAGSDTSSETSKSTGSFLKGQSAHTEPLIYSTPAPVLVTHPHNSSSAQDLPSQIQVHGHEPSNTQQTLSPVFIYYSPISTSAQTVSSKASETANIYRPLVTGVYSTPIPLFLSQSQGSLLYSSSGAEENLPEESIRTINNGEAGHITKSEDLSHTSEYISHSPKSTSFSVSNSVGSSQSSSSLTTAGNADSGHITGNSVHSTTPPTAVLSHSSSDAVGSERYVANTDTILLSSNPQPAAESLTSSSEVLAPIQGGVSLGTVSYQQATAVAGVPSATTVTSQPAQVKEEKQDVEQPRTVVEVQKAVSLDFHSLTLKPEENEKPNPETPSLGKPISYSQEVVEDGRNIELNNEQHQIITGNLIEYGYGHPLTGLHVHPQIGYGLARQVAPAEQVLYEYNPEIFEAQKVTHFKYDTPQQSQGTVQQAAPYESSFGPDKQEQQRKYTQTQNPGLSQTIQVIERENPGVKYQFKQQSESNLQPQRLSVIENQQEATSYNQHSNGEAHKILSQLLPGVVQSVHTESQLPKYQAPLQIEKDLPYQQPLEISHIIQNRPPTDISQHLTYPLFSQQVNYKEPVELNQQFELLTPVHLNEPLEQAVNTAALQFDYRLHKNLLPEGNLPIRHNIFQGTNVGSQSTNQSQLAYNSPRKVSEQLQSEYNHQLLEEEKQEQVRFISEIGKALKQVGTEYEGGVGTQVPVYTLKEEKSIPLPVAVEFPALPLPPTTVVPLDTSHQVVKLGQPVSIEHTKLVTVDKPLPAHHAKVVEKPIPVPQAVPVEITKLVPVDRPVPFPQPFAVPHPVPVPYAVPHPIGVPVPHLVPYPHLVTVPYKELHPVYFHSGKTHKHELGLYGQQVQNFPGNTPLPIILKALQYNGGRYGEPVSLKHHRFHFPPRLPQPVYLTPPPLKSSGRGLQRPRQFDHPRSLCIEYGFKPPLIPSLQIGEIPPSEFGPLRKD